MTQTVIVAIWLAANIVLLSRPFDAFPFGDAQNERLLTGNTEILKQVAALEARILIWDEPSSTRWVPGRLRRIRKADRNRR